MSPEHRRHFPLYCTLQRTMLTQRLRSPPRGLHCPILHNHNPLCTLAREYLTICQYLVVSSCMHQRFLSRISVTAVNVGNPSKHKIYAFLDLVVGPLVDLPDATTPFDFASSSTTVAAGCPPRPGTSKSFMAIAADVLVLLLGRPFLPCFCSFLYVAK